MAFVLSSLSGNLISAASAGFAPTNSADVSAIASAYQVVSATATQLNAGTAYLTSVNETPISASRAGNAANASLANSAWYDGTGRLISALPDEATVSSIASAYAESAASSKLDSSASSSFYTTANESGFITGLPIDISVRDLSASRRVRATATGEDLYGNFDYAGMYFRSGSNRPYNIGMDNTGANFYIATAKNGFERIYASSIQSWNGKLDGSASSSYYTTANESGYVDSAYVESQVSGKQDTLTFDWDSNSAISSINGSALAGQGGGGGSPIVVTGTAWDSDTSAYVYPTSNLSAAEGNVWTWQNGNKSNYIGYLKDDSGNRFPMMAAFLAAGAQQMYYGSFDQNGRLQFSPSQSMFSADGSNKYGLSPLTYATGASMNLSAGYFRASYRGDTIFISRGPTGTIDSSNSSQIKAIRIEAHNARGSNISAYDATTTGYYGTTGMSVCKSGVSSDDSGNTARSSVSARLSTGSLLFHSAGSSESMSITSIPYWNAKLDVSAIECDTASAITAIGGSAIAGGGGGGGVDSATVSAIASSYAESAASSKLDTTAQVVTSIDETYPATGGTFISQINGTNIFAVTADSASSWAGASSKVDQSAYDDLYSAFTALSGVISTYSAYFSSISAKVDNSAIGVTE